MTTVVESVPEELRPEVEAALAWLNAERGADYEVTGVVDPEATVAARAADGSGEESYELGLVLCQEDRCLREQLVLRPIGSGFDVSLVVAPGLAGAKGDTARLAPPATLDPRAGARRGWLAARLAEHAFVVLIFYRGFW
jgi:hypothetical protein